MGVEYVYKFTDSGLNRKPEELSAEVLKQLKADVAARTGEDVHSAVITVPAAFELHQCDATRKAAELAGLKGSPLLQEPVAAALAYGFQIDSERAYWLVYDFGGGTFDCALVKADEGLINVVHHGGNNFLGGADIDWAILDRLITPKLSGAYDLPEFKRGNLRWEPEVRKLKRAIEIAKIELSTKERSSLMDCSFQDASGHLVDCEELTLSRNEVLSVAEPIIRRSTDICLKVLKDKNLPASAVQKVILVGGPTKAPYFREILNSNLGIEADFSMDPLTVVAKGAAVFAGTQKIDTSLLQRAKVGEYSIEMLESNKSIGHETDPLAGGKVSDPNGGSVDGFTIEFVNNKTQWRSGKITIRLDGVFLVNLLAERNERNVFSLELYNAEGIKQRTVPDHYIYTVGAVVEEQPLINSVGVVLADNSVDWLFAKGHGLPLKKRCEKPYHTVKALKVGEDGDAIVIPIVEGENQIADRNRKIGELKIKASKIRRHVPEGSEVDVTLHMSKSRILTIEAYIPILDEVYEQLEDQRELRKEIRSAESLSQDLNNELKRLRSLLDIANEAVDSRTADELEQLQTSDLVQEIREAVAASKSDADAAEKADKRLLELKLRIDEADNTIHWPTMVSKIRELLDDLDNLVKQHGTDRQQQRAQELAGEIADIIAKKQADRLSRKEKQVYEVYCQVLFSIPAYWVGQFQRLERERGKMTNRQEASRRIEMGRKYLEENNVDGLRNVVFKLWDLLPKQVVEDVHRGFGAGVIR
jgi:molecular chaperone DnaK